MEDTRRLNQDAEIETMCNLLKNILIGLFIGINHLYDTSFLILLCSQFIGSFDPNLFSKFYNIVLIIILIIGIVLSKKRNQICKKIFLLHLRLFVLLICICYISYSSVSLINSIVVINQSIKSSIKNVSDLLRILLKISFSLIMLFAIIFIFIISVYWFKTHFLDQNNCIKEKSEILIILIGLTMFILGFSLIFYRDIGSLFYTLSDCGKYTILSGYLPFLIFEKITCWDEAKRCAYNTMIFKMMLTFGYVSYLVMNYLVNNINSPIITDYLFQS